MPRKNQDGSSDNDSCSNESKYNAIMDAAAEFISKSVVANHGMYLDEQHELDGLDILQMLRRMNVQANIDGDSINRVVSSQIGQVVWAIVSTELTKWLGRDVTDENIKHEDIAEKVSSRETLRGLLLKQYENLPTHYVDGVKYVNIMMPIWLFADVYNGLSALNENEVQEIFRPTYNASHGNAWTRNNAQHRVIEYALFKKGLHKTSESDTYKLISDLSGVLLQTIKALKKNSVFKTDAFRRRRDLAFKAGRLKRMLNADPQQTKIGDDPDVYDMLLTFENESEKQIADELAKVVTPKKPIRPSRRRQGKT